MDGGGFSPCTSPFTANGLAAGDHSFDVRAKDQPGNVDPTPASAAWTVTAPAQQQTQPPPLAAPGKVAGVKVKRKKTSAVIRWKAVPGATSYVVKSGKKSTTTTGTSFRVKKLKAGKKYAVTINAVNAAGPGPSAKVKVKKFR